MQKIFLSVSIALGLSLFSLSQASFAQQTTTRTGPQGNAQTTTRAVGNDQQTTTRTGPQGNTQTTTRTGPQGNTQTTTRTWRR